MDGSLEIGPAFDNICFQNEFLLNNAFCEENY